MDTTDSDADVHLLVPQSVTLDEVEVTPELVETHCVLLQRGFRSLNGLCGTCQPLTPWWCTGGGRAPPLTTSEQVVWLSR